MPSSKDIVQEMTKVGGQYALTNRYRHPSVSSFVTSGRGGRGVFDLEKITEVLQSALSFIEQLGRKKQIILFVSSRRETVDLVERIAADLSMPYMLNRWIGGTLSNFKNIKGRVDRMERLRKDSEEGKWSKYTKKERVLLNRELAKLENWFSGIGTMDVLPGAVFVLDVKKEAIAVSEANSVGISVIGFSNADADLTVAGYPIIANIHSHETVAYVLSLVKEAYEAGVKGGKDTK